ncbi:hypothetical protein YC2023_109467 [Brassica napus]
MLTKPVSPIPEERFRFRDHDLLLGLANTHTQLPGTSLLAIYLRLITNTFLNVCPKVTWPVFLFVLGDQSCDFYMQMQAVILQPLGDKGITVIGGKTTIYMLHVFRIGKENFHFFVLFVA